MTDIKILDEKIDKTKKYKLEKDKIIEGFTNSYDLLSCDNILMILIAAIVIMFIIKKNKK